MFVDSEGRTVRISSRSAACHWTLKVGRSANFSGSCFLLQFFLALSLMAPAAQTFSHPWSESFRAPLAVNVWQRPAILGSDLERASSITGAKLKLFACSPRDLQEACTPQILSLHLVQGCRINFSGDSPHHRMSLHGRLRDVRPR